MIDWVAAFTPSKNHPDARNFENSACQAWGTTRELAITNLLELARQMYDIGDKQ